MHYQVEVTSMSNITCNITQKMGQPVQPQLWLIPRKYLITRFSSSLKSSAQISLDAYSYRFLSGDSTTMQARMLRTLRQPFMQNSQPVLTTSVMLCTSSDFSSSRSGDFQQSNLLLWEMQTNLGCGSRVLGECLRKRKPLRMWVSTSPTDSLQELQSLRRLVGEEDVLLQVRVEPFISSMAIVRICLMRPILAIEAFARCPPDFILNISRQFYEKGLTVSSLYTASLQIPLFLPESGQSMIRR